MKYFSVAIRQQGSQQAGEENIQGNSVATEDDLQAVPSQAGDFGTYFYGHEMG